MYSQATAAVVKQLYKLGSGKYADEVTGFHTMKNQFIDRNLGLPLGLYTQDWYNASISGSQVN